MKLPIVEMLIDEDNGVTAVSLVDKPAIEEEFIKLSKDVEISLNSDKMIVTGPALIPNKEIYRNYITGVGPGYIFFSEDTVRQIAKQFMMSDDMKNTTLQHKVDTNDAELIESWIVENPEMDKSKHYGFDVPAGTWMLSYQIKDEQLWEDIKSGKINGFSIEASFSKGELIDDNEFTDTELEELINFINGLTN